jgi:hypothetical protein
VERLLAIVQIRAVAGRIYEWVGFALLEFRVFGRHAVVVAVRSQEQIAGQRAQDLKTALVIRRDLRSGFR